MANPNDFSLNDKLINLSISDCTDLQEIGLAQKDLDILLEKIVTQLITHGAKIGYEGNLEHDGFTYQLFSDVSSQSILQTSQFIHYLSYPTWKSSDAISLFSHILGLHNIGEVQLFLPDGSSSVLVSDGETIQVLNGPLKALSSDALISSPDQLQALWDCPNTLDASLLQVLQSIIPISQSLAAMRQVIAAREDARVVIGGLVSGYEGDVPGVAEGAIATIKAKKTLIPIASYGGCARFISHSLGLIAPTQLLPQQGFGQNFDQSMHTLTTLEGQFNSTLGFQKLDQLKQITLSQKPGYVADGILSLVS